MNIKHVFLLSSFLLFTAGCQPATPATENSEVASPAPVEEAAPVSTTTGEGDLPVYTLDEVAMHNSQDDCWTVVDGQVGDVTSFFGEHPGGDRDLARACGVDASEMFAREREHNPKGYEQFQEFVIGVLE